MKTIQKLMSKKETIEQENARKKQADNVENEGDHASLLSEGAPEVMQS